MNKNKSPLKNQDKRLYYQYLGFLNAVNLFSKDIINIKYFDFKTEPISYERFQSFSLDVKVPLGKRVERFFEFYIEQGQDYKIVKQNIQINHDKRTIGEFDFFLEDLKTKKIIHVELVYKFYIYKEHHEEIKRYHGPNNHDNLEEKLHKLETKQFPLLYNAYAKEALEEFEVLDVSQELCFLGNVFVKPQSKIEFQAVNKASLVGSYVSFEEFLEEDDYREQRYFIPQKEDWLMEEKYGEFWFDYVETVEKMEKYFKSNISLLLWVKREFGFERMFVIL